MGQKQNKVGWKTEQESKTARCRIPVFKCGRRSEPGKNLKQKSTKNIITQLKEGAGLSPDSKQHLEDENGGLK